MYVVNILQAYVSVFLNLMCDHIKPMSVYLQQSVHKINEDCNKQT